MADINQLNEQLNEQRDQLIQGVSNEQIAQDQFALLCEKWKECAAQLDFLKEQTNPDIIDHTESVFIRMLEELKMETYALQDQILDAERSREETVRLVEQKIHRSSAKIIDLIKDDFGRFETTGEKNEAIDKVTKSVESDLKIEADILNEKADTLQKNAQKVEKDAAFVKKQSSWLSQKAEALSNDADARFKTKSRLNVLAGLGEKAAAAALKTVENAYTVVKQCRETARDIRSYSFEVRSLNLQIRLALLKDDYLRPEAVSNRKSLETFAQEHISEFYDPKKQNDSLLKITAFFDPEFDLSKHSEQDIIKYGALAEKNLMQEKEWMNELLKKAKNMDSEHDHLVNKKETIGKSKGFIGAFASKVFSWQNQKAGTDRIIDGHNKFYTNEDAPSLHIGDIESRLQSIDYELSHIREAVTHKVEERRLISDESKHFKNLFSERLQEEKKAHRIPNILSVTIAAYKDLREEKAKQMSGEDRFLEDCETLEDRFNEYRDMFEDITKYCKSLATDKIAEWKEQVTDHFKEAFEGER